MQELNLSTFSKGQLEKLHSDAVHAIEEIFNKEEVDNIYEQVDLALNQTYRDGELVGNLIDKLGSVDTNSDIDTAREAERDLNESDEFSDLYSPLVYRTHKGWVTHLKEALLSGDKFYIKRKHSKFFKDLGLEDFLPVVDECWKRNIEVENERFKIDQKLRRAITQFAAYGGSPGVVFYDHQEAFADLKVMPLRDYGIYPISDEWHKSINIFRYDVNYSDLLAREDLNQDIVNQIKPWTEWSQNNNNISDTPTSRSSEYEDTESPYGKVRIHEIYIPSLYLEGQEEDNEDIVGSGIHLIALYNPLLKRGASAQELGGEHGLYILKATEDVSYTDFTILFAAFDDVLPGQQIGKGPIIPFLIFQAIQNQLISGMVRDIARETDPPLKVSSAENSIEDTPIPAFAHGAIYEGLEVEALTIPGYENRLLATKDVIKYLDETVETASGMNKLSLGGRPATKRTKFEVQEQQDAGSIRIDDSADLFEEGYLKPFNVSRLAQEQYQLKTQVESGMEFITTLDPTLTANRAYDLVLSENKLFNRLLEFTEMESKYEDFYASHQERLRENELYTAEFQRIMSSIYQLQQQLQAPYQAFQDPEDNETLNEASVDVARQEFYAMQDQQRMQMQQQLDQLTEKAKVTQGLIENLKQIPEPSNYLYYKLLEHPIKQSDCIIHGAKSTLNKSITRRAALDLLDVIAKLGIPPESIQDFLMEIDIAEILKPYMSSIDLPYSDVKKSTPEINRIKQQIQQREQAVLAQAQSQQQ